MFGIFPGDKYLSLKGFWHMHAGWLMVDMGFCMLSLYLLISCTDHWEQWVELCVNQWS